MPTSTGTKKVEGEQKWYLLAPPSLERVPTFLPPCRCFKINKWVSYAYVVGTFQNCCFLIGSWGECVCVTDLLRANFSFFIAVILLEISPNGFEGQLFWVFISSVQVPELGCLMWNTNPSSGTSPIYEIPPNCGSLCLGRGFLVDCVFPLPMHLSVAPLAFIFKGIVHLAFRSFSEGIVPCQCSFVFVGGGEFRVLLSCHLELFSLW